MPLKFKVGDHVIWNSEAGHVSGTIIKKHTKGVAYKGYTHHASEDEPQYEIQSDKSDHIAIHKESALHRAIIESENTTAHLKGIDILVLAQNWTNGPHKTQCSKTRYSQNNPQSFRH